VRPCAERRITGGIRAAFRFGVAWLKGSLGGMRWAKESLLHSREGAGKGVLERRERSPAFGRKGSEIGSRVEARAGHF